MKYLIITKVPFETYFSEPFKSLKKARKDFEHRQFTETRASEIMLVRVIDE